MRTTLTIDDDIAVLLEKEHRHSGEPFKQVVNRVLRSGLAHTATPVKGKRFKVKPHSLNLPVEWTSGSTHELIEMVEGTDLR